MEESANGLTQELEQSVGYRNKVTGHTPDSDEHSLPEEKLKRKLTLLFRLPDPSGDAEEVGEPSNCTESPAAPLSGQHTAFSSGEDTPISHFKNYHQQQQHHQQTRPVLNSHVVVFNNKQGGKTTAKSLSGVAASRRLNGANPQGGIKRYPTHCHPEGSDSTAVSSNYRAPHTVGRSGSPAATNQDAPSSSPNCVGVFRTAVTEKGHGLKITDGSHSPLSILPSLQDSISVPRNQRSGNNNCNSTTNGTVKSVSHEAFVGGYLPGSHAKQIGREDKSVYGDTSHRPSQSLDRFDYRLPARDVITTKLSKLYRYPQVENNGIVTRNRSSSFPYDRRNLRSTYSSNGTDRKVAVKAKDFSIQKPGEFSENAKRGSLLPPFHGSVSVNGLRQGRLDSSVKTQYSRKKTRTAPSAFLRNTMTSSQPAFSITLHASGTLETTGDAPSGGVYDPTSELRSSYYTVSKIQSGKHPLRTSAAKVKGSVEPSTALYGCTKMLHSRRYKSCPNNLQILY